MDVMALFDSLIAQLQDGKQMLEGEKAASFQAGKDEGDKAGYERGYAEGKASVVLPVPGTGEILFTQDDMDKVSAVAKDEVRAELQPQIDELKVQVQAAQSDVEAIKAEFETFKAQAEAAKNEAVAQAIGSFKAELKAKYEEQQVVETSQETGFGALLA